MLILKWIEDDRGKLEANLHLMHESSKSRKPKYDELVSSTNE